MPAYIVVNMTVIHQAELAAYDAEVNRLVTDHGGRFIVRGGEVETLEGTWHPNRVIILEFPDMQAIRTFYGSEKYAPLLARRLAASSSDIIAVEGIA